MAQSNLPLPRGPRKVVLPFSVDVVPLRRRSVAFDPTAQRCDLSAIALGAVLSMNALAAWVPTREPGQSSMPGHGTRLGGRPISPYPAAAAEAVADAVFTAAR